MQARVANYYKSKGLNRVRKSNRGMKPGTRACQCYNMCYAEGTEEEIKDIDTSTQHTCVCYHSRYEGSMAPDIARPLEG
jgi:fructose-1,6-bisphosphatase